MNRLTLVSIGIFEIFTLYATEIGLRPQLSGKAPDGSYAWTIDGDTLVQVHRCHRNDSEHIYGWWALSGTFTIPCEVSGYDDEDRWCTYQIKSVGHGTQDSGLEDLSVVILSEGIERIESGFMNCANLTAAFLPTTLRSMDNAFSGCSALKSIVIPEDVNNMGYSSFSGCTCLKDISMPSAITQLGDKTFYGCTSLTNIALPSSCTKIGSQAFKNCTSLRLANIGGCKDIGSSAFYDCSNLQCVASAENVTNISNYAFYNCVTLQTPQTPSNLIAIGDYAFYRCGQLRGLEFPNKLRTIGSYAFNNCVSLTEVILPDGFRDIGSYAFKNDAAITKIYLPSTVSSIGTSAFSGVYPKDLSESILWSTLSLESVTNLVILEGPTAFGDYQKTSRHDALKRIELPESVTAINSQALYQCTNLREVVIHGEIGSVEKKAFYECRSLREIPDLGDSVTNWGESVFQYCSSLTSIHVPRSMKTIPASMFANCTKLKEVTIEEGVETIPYTAFVGDTSLRMVSIPSTASNLTSTTSTSSSYLPYKQADIICYRTDPPANFYKAFLRNFAGNLYYPPAGKDAWEAMLDQNGLSARGKSWVEADENASATVSINNTPVTLGWLAKYKLTESERPDVAAAKSTGKLDGSNNELCVWHDFIAGTDPTNKASLLSAKIEMVNGIPLVQWSPDLNENGTKAIRTYKVWGKETLDDTSDWEYPTNSLHNFFKVTVEMP